MSDEQALIAAIISRPEEDTPRLMLADWYDENGQPDRGEFIRVQVEHARLESGDPRLNDLEARASELLLQKDWQKPLGQELGVMDTSFERGLVHYATVKLNGYLEHAAEIHSLVPLQSLYIVCGQEVTPATLLHLWEVMPPTVDTLSLSQMGMTHGTEEVTECLQAIGQMDCLRSLALDSTALFQGGQEEVRNQVRELARMQHLDSMNLSYNSLGLEDAEERIKILCRLKNLRQFSLHNCDLESIVPLRHFANLTKLESLDLSGNPLGSQGPDDYQGLGFLRELPRLRYLSMRECNLTRVDELWDVLALRNLEALDIGYNEFQDAAEFNQALAEAAQPRLHTLHAEITPEIFWKALTAAYQHTIDTQGEQESMVNLVWVNGERLPEEVEAKRLEAKAAYEAKYPPSPTMTAHEVRKLGVPMMWRGLLS